MLYREVAQQDIDYKYDKYLFVGFNMVQKVEQKIFSNLQKKIELVFIGTLIRFICRQIKTKPVTILKNTLKTFLMSLNRLTKVSIITCLQAKELHMLTHPQKTFRQDT